MSGGNGGAAGADAAPPGGGERPLVADVHVHVAGIGLECSGCHVQPRTLRSLPFRLMARDLGVSRGELIDGLETAYKRVLFAAIDGAPSLDRAVLLAHDAVFNEDGSMNEVRSQLVTPNEHVWRLASLRPDKLRFGASVHPYRRGAAETLERWISAGAVLLKWLPSSQAIDPRDPRCAAIYRVLARRGVPLLVHTGSETVVRVYRKDLASPEILRPALDEGVTVIAAHCGTSSFPLLFKSHLREFARLCEAYPNLYGDTAAFCSPYRGREVHARLSDAGLVSRLVHGSDFPVPTHPFWFPRRLAGRVRELESIASPLERDIRTKRALGYPEAVFTRGAALLRLGGEKTRRRDALATPAPGKGG